VWNLAEGTLLDHPTAQGFQPHITGAESPITDVPGPETVVANVDTPEAVVYDVAAVDAEHGVRGAAERDKQRHRGDDIRVRQVLSK
jgi:hypothetical protein